eukprot:scaffold3246_cov88-Skeletonema_menzelii.AAC.2
MPNKTHSSVLGFICAFINRISLGVDISPDPDDIAKYVANTLETDIQAQANDFKTARGLCKT